MRDRVVKRTPSDRTEEPDRVVLEAIALPVVGDHVLFLALLGVARLLGLRAPQHGLDALLDHLVVLPGQRQLEARLPSDLPDLGAEPSGFGSESRLVGGPVLVHRASADEPVGGSGGQRRAQPGTLPRIETRRANHRRAPECPARVRLSGVGGHSLSPTSASTEANSAAVGYVKNNAGEISVPVAVSMIDTTSIASMESPPIAKKSSSGCTCGCPSTSA